MRKKKLYRSFEHTLLHLAYRNRHVTHATEQCTHKTSSSWTASTSHATSTWFENKQQEHADTDKVHQSYLPLSLAEMRLAWLARYWPRVVSRTVGPICHTLHKHKCHADGPPSSKKCQFPNLLFTVTAVVQQRELRSNVSLLRPCMCSALEHACRHTLADSIHMVAEQRCSTDASKSTCTCKTTSKCKSTGTTRSHRTIRRSRRCSL